MSTLKVNTIQDTSGGSGSTPEQIKKGTCKAWINFSGMGTVSIRESYNVSSLTDDATGRYTVSFSTAMPVEDFSCFITHSYGSTAKGGSDDGDHINGIGTIRRTGSNTTTGQLKMICGYGFSNSCQDGAQICAGIFC